MHTLLDHILPTRGSTDLPLQLLSLLLVAPGHCLHLPQLSLHLLLTGPQGVLQSCNLCPALLPCTVQLPCGVCVCLLLLFQLTGETGHCVRQVSSLRLAAWEGEEEGEGEGEGEGRRGEGGKWREREGGGEREREGKGEREGEG